MKEPEFVDVDMRDIVGPDRILPCGCRVINGMICFCSHAKIDGNNLFSRPGRVIPVDGGTK